MPLILALIGALQWAMGSLVGQVLLALGISFVTYQGVDTGTAFMKTQAFSSINALPPIMVQLFGVFQIGTAINIIFSAMVARMTMQGIAGGKLTKMITRK